MHATSSSSSNDTHTIDLSTPPKWKKEVKKLFKKSKQGGEINDKPKRKALKLIMAQFFLKKEKRPNNLALIAQPVVGNISIHEDDDDGGVTYDDVVPFDRDRFSSEPEATANQLQKSVNTYDKQYDADSTHSVQVENSFQEQNEISFTDLSTIKLFHPMSPTLTPAKLMLMSPFESMVTTVRKDRSDTYAPTTVLIKSPDSSLSGGY